MLDSKRINRYKSTYKRLAFLLVMVLLLVGCSSPKNTSSIASPQSTSSTENESVVSAQSSTQAESGSQQNTTTESSSQAEISSQENESYEEIASSKFSSSTKEEETVQSQGKEVVGISVTENSNDKTPRNDATEVTRQRYPANLAYGYKGYADKEASKLREEILDTPNTLDIYDIKGDIFYVSPSGDNDNDGLSPETAIRTIDAIASLQLKRGDAVLFERDSLFRIYERFYLRAGITYGSYGKGDKPLIVGSPKNYATVIWEPSTKRNVWVTSYPYNMPVGAFFNQGEEVGYLKTGIRDLTTNTYFFYDEEFGKLYLYCDKGNPSDVYNSIEFTQNKTDLWVSSGVDDVTVDNIAIRYATCGVGTNFMNDNLVVTNCEIGFTGGGGTDPTRLRAGNGVGTWCGGAGMKVNHNWIYQTFDSAISPQGNSGKFYYYDNMEYLNNLLEFNNADIEWWEHGNDTYTEEMTWSRFVNFRMEDNIMRFTSCGWGTRADDGGIRGIEGVWYGNTGGNLIKGVTFINNIIDCPGRQIFNFSVYDREQLDGMKFANNTYYVKNSLRSDNVRMVYGWDRYVDGVVRSYFGTDEASTKQAISLVDPTAKIYWYK